MGKLNCSECYWRCCDPNIFSSLGSRGHYVPELWCQGRPVEHRNHRVSVPDWEGSFSGEHAAVTGWMLIDSGLHSAAGTVFCNMRRFTQLLALLFWAGPAATSVTFSLPATALQHFLSVRFLIPLLTGVTPHCARKTDFRLKLMQMHLFLLFCLWKKSSFYIPGFVLFLPLTSLWRRAAYLELFLVSKWNLFCQVMSLQVIHTYCKYLLKQRRLIERDLSLNVHFQY